MSLVRRSEINSPIMQSNNLSTVSFPQKTKCEFCNVNFKCDLDVSRHLASPTHRTKRDEHLSLLKRQEKTLEKRSPKSLKMVYDALKLRTARDLQDLVDKDYFVFPNESTTKIAEVMVRRLSLAVFKYETRNSKETYKEAKDEIMKSLERECPKEPAPRRRARQEKNHAPSVESPNQEPVERQERKKAKTAKTSKSVNANITARISPGATPQVVSSRDVPTPSTSKNATSLPTSSLDAPGTSTNSSAEIPEPSAPSTTGPKLGQNWDFRPTFAKIKVEPKD